MQQLANFFKKVQLGKILAIFLVGISLFITTTSNLQAQAGRVNNSSAQVGKPLVSHSESELLYPGAETVEGRIQKERELPKITDGKTSTKQSPQERSGNNRRDRDIKQVAKRAGNMFKEASEFAQEKGDEAGRRPEMKVNPAVQK